MTLVLLLVKDTPETVTFSERIDVTFAQFFSACGGMGHYNDEAYLTLGIEGNPMPRTTRSENLDLIRHLNSGHKPTAKKLAGITNENYISQMATGEKEISDGDARRIENVLVLPDGWIDRDNIAMLGMGKLDFELYSRLRGESEEAKAGLLAFLSLTATPKS